VAWAARPTSRILEIEMTAGPGLAARRDPSTLSRALGALAELEFRLGDWPAAHDAAREALRGARTGALRAEVLCGLTRLALIEAGMGRERECRAHAGEALRLAAELEDRPMEALAGEALGLLELGLGRLDAAIERLEAVGRLCGGCTLSWASDLADARVRRGDLAAARRVLNGVEAGRRPNCVQVAALERSRAMLAPRHAYGRLFTRTLELCAWSRQPFELARTELCFGERLQRARRRREAETHLAAALEVFEELTARPWAERARRELAAV
jgi:tetratricopeptide (TPR) repeat protein